MYTFIFCSQTISNLLKFSHGNNLSYLEWDQKLVLKLHKPCEGGYYTFSLSQTSLEVQPSWTCSDLMALWKQTSRDWAPPGTDTQQRNWKETEELGIAQVGPAFFSMVIIQCAKIDTLNCCYGFLPMGELVLATGW